MLIEMTVPIMVNNEVICEFDAAVDVKVTSYGSPAKTSGPPEYCDPGEGPEWEVEGTYVDVPVRNEEDKLVSKLVDCPDELLTFITQYIEGAEFADKVCSEIAEDGSHGEYDPY